MASGQRQITRSRPFLSCYACRRRKVKCEKQRPTCENCRKVNEKCIYDNNEDIGEGKTKDRRRKNPQQGGPSSSSSSSSSANANTNTDSKSNRQQSGAPENDWEEVTKANSTFIFEDSSEQRYSTSDGGIFASSRTPLISHASHPSDVVDAGYSSSGNIRDGGLQLHMDRFRKMVQKQRETVPPSATTLDSLGDDTASSISSSKRNNPFNNTTTVTSSSRQFEALERGILTPEADPIYAITPPPVHNVFGGDSTVASPRRGFRSPISQTEEKPEVLGYLNMQSGGRCRYVDNTFWALLGNHTRECNLLLRDNCKPRMMGPNAIGLAKSLHSLPPKPMCDQLLKSFLIGVHPILPLIHTPTFLGEYDSFWSWYPNSSSAYPPEKLVADPSFLPLVFAVLLCGAVAATPKFWGSSVLDGLHRGTLIELLNTGVSSTLKLCQFPRVPTLDSLVAALLAQSCLDGEEQPLGNSGFVGMAIRAAQSMGCHRDGSLFGLNEVESEVRRRVWWHIVYLDVQSTIVSGLQPLGSSDEDSYDAQMVSELRDEDIGSSKESRRPNGGPTNSPGDGATSDPRISASMLFAIGRYEATKVLRQIISRLHNIHPPTPRDLKEMSESVATLNAKLDVIILQLPAKGVPEKGFISSQQAAVDPAGNERLYEDSVERPTVFNSWARIMLCMMRDYVWILLYRPFLRSGDSGGMWASTIQLCHSFLRNFIQLSCIPAFAPYYWFCPGHFQPLQATMIVLTYLEEQPASADPDLTRHLVDEIFDIFSSEDQSEAAESLTQPVRKEERPFRVGSRGWDMLKRLRRKADDRVDAQCRSGTVAYRPRSQTTGDAITSAPPFPTAAALSGLASLTQHHRQASKSGTSTPVSTRGRGDTTSSGLGTYAHPFSPASEARGKLGTQIGEDGRAVKRQRSEQPPSSSARHGTGHPITSSTATAAAVVAASSGGSAEIGAFEEDMIDFDAGVGNNSNKSSSGGGAKTNNSRFSEPLSYTHSSTDVARRRNGDNDDDDDDMGSAGILMQLEDEELDSKISGGDGEDVFGGRGVAVATPASFDFNFISWITMLGGEEEDGGI